MSESKRGCGKPDDSIRATVQIDGKARVARYVRQPFRREAAFGVTSVNYDLCNLLERSLPPSRVR
jgi:hypothetical protein